MVIVNPEVSKTIRQKIESVYQNVEAGAKLLDEKNPEWYRVVDLMNIPSRESPGRRILTQLYIKQCDGQKELGIWGCRDESGQLLADKYGFSLGPKHHGFNQDAIHAWSKEISLRRLKDEQKARETDKKF